jgi:PKD repeat protein
MPLMKTRLFLGIVLLSAVAAIGVLGAPPALAQYPKPPDQPPAPRRVPRPLAAPPGWTQINASGFGETNNWWVNALDVFGGSLYAGASTQNSSGGQIWRYTNSGIDWTNVVTAGFQSPTTTWDISNTWVSDLEPYHGFLYAGTQNLNTGGEIWSSGDGLNWTPVMTGGFGAPSNQEIMHLTVYSDTLYASAGDWGTPPFALGGQVWRTSNGVDWTNVVTQGFGTISSTTIIGLEGIGGFLYAGTWSDLVPGQLWRSATGDADSWQPLTTDGFGDSGNRGIPALAYFDGYLYAGTRSWTTGAQVWRSPDGLSWTQVVSQGFGGGLDEGWVDSLTVFGSKLYAVARNYNKGSRVYSTTDGLQWSQIQPDGWNDPANQHTSDGNNGVAVFNGALIIGTYNIVAGGQAWRLDPVSISGLAAVDDSPTKLGLATNFTATITAGNGESYDWSFGDGATGSGNVVSYTYPNPGVYAAVVTATNFLGHESASTTVTVAQEISGLGAINDSPTKLGSPTHLTATVTAGSVDSYDWSFGDGAIGSGAVVTYSYPIAGVYTATVTATNVVGSVSAATTVTIVQGVSGLVATNDSPTKLGLATNLTATIAAGSADSYDWYFGDGAIGSGAVVSRTYANVGVYTVWVTATDLFGPVSASTIVTVAADITGLTTTNTSPKPVGVPVRFTAAANGSSIEYQWNFADGSATGVGSPVTHTYALSGTYTAIVTATNPVDAITTTTPVTITALIIQYLPLLEKQFRLR